MQPRCLRLASSGLSYNSSTLDMNLSLHSAASMLTSIGCGVSLCTMTTISVDRFLALYYHMRYPNLMTERRALRSSSAVWFMCVLISCLRLLKNVSTVLAVAGIALCICISTFSYIRIYQIVQSSASVTDVRSTTDCAKFKC